MDRERTELQPKMQRAVDLALDGESTPAIAERLGVDRSTVWRWMQLPEVADELKWIRIDRRGEIRAAVDAGAREAVGYLRAVVADSNASVHARVRAAVVLLDRADLGSDRNLESTVRITFGPGFPMPPPTELPPPPILPGCE
jgi:hypothetical protein